MVSSLFASLLGPEVPSFRALSGRLECTVRRHKSNKDSLASQERDSAGYCHQPLSSEKGTANQGQILAFGFAVEVLTTFQVIRSSLERKWPQCTEVPRP